MMDIRPRDRQRIDYAPIQAREDIETVSIVSAPAMPSSHNAGRRGFLRLMGVGAAAVMANTVTPDLAWSKDSKYFKDSEMDKEDEIIAKALKSTEGAEPEMDMMEGDKATKPTEIQIKKFIDLIISKASTSGKGVHMQQHENVMWLIAYFNYKKETPKGILYYPSKIGLESKFVKAIEKKEGVTITKFSRSKIDKKGEVNIYLKPGEALHETNKVRGIEAVIDAGTAYVIIPAGTPIIEYTDRDGNKKGMLAECRNPIKRYLSECPPSK